MRVAQGDVTRLEDADVGNGFRLVRDTGTFHDFAEPDRMVMGRGVDAVAADGATVFLLVWPKLIRPLIRGLSRRKRGPTVRTFLTVRTKPDRW